MKAKKLFPAVLSLGLLIGGGLAGCSSGDDKTSGEGGKDGDKVTVDIFQFKVEFKDQFEDIAKAYEEANKDVDINITTVGGGEDYGVALKSKFASGNEPTIYNVGGPQDVADWEDKLADLSDTVTQKRPLAELLKA